MLVAGDYAQLRPVLLGIENRCLPFSGQIFEGTGVKYRLVKLPTLHVAHLAQRRVADHLLDAAAQRGAGPLGRA